MAASYKALAQYQKQDADTAVRSVTLSLADACNQHHCPMTTEICPPRPQPRVCLAKFHAFWDVMHTEPHGVWPWGLAFFSRSVVP